MRRVISIGLAALVMGALGACGDASIGDAAGVSNPGTQDSTQTFLIEENTSTVLRGRLITADGQLSFFATSDNAETLVGRIQINDKIFDLTIDGSYILDGHNVVLSAADQALLLTLINELSARFTDATSLSPRVQAVGALASHLAEAPEGHIHRRLVDGIAVPEGTLASAGNGIITCLTKGRTYTAVYDDRYGQTTSEYVVAGANWGLNAAGTGGDYSCMGMCGAGCRGIFGMYRYSKDCLNHDACSHDKNASGGSSDLNCGDEYDAASDDGNPFGSRCGSTI